MKTSNQLQKKDNLLSRVRRHSGKIHNNKDEIYRMMLFLNLISDESLSQPNIPIVSEDKKSHENGKQLKAIYPNIILSN